MTRERWEQILFAHVPDEVVQDMLNAYVLEIESENAKLRELVEAMPYCMKGKCLECPLCSYFEPAIGGVPECEALPMLYALGIYGDDADKFGVTPF